VSKRAILKLFVSIVMLALVYLSVDFTQLAASLHQVSLPYLALFVVGYAVSQGISALRWWIVCRGAGIPARLTRAISSSFVGMYVNVFGFGTLGGDMIRAWLLTPNPEYRETSFATVVADRSFGLATLAAIGILSSLFAESVLDTTVRMTALFLVGAVVVAWFFVPWIAGRFPANGWFATRVIRISRGFPRSPRSLGLMLIVAIIFHLMQIALFGLLALSINVSIPFSYLLATIPFSNIISTLPLSWMGLGVRENVYVFFFVPAFLNNEQAILCGALWLLAMTVTSAIGGIVAVLGGDLEEMRRSSQVNDTGGTRQDTIHAA
jgi:uncharacterized membrane protein YbhN (UPF0104 family)